MLGLKQIPLIPILILEHGHNPVHLIPRGLHKLDPFLNHPLVVPIEIVRVQEQENAAPCLVADTRALALVVGLGEKDGGLAVGRGSDSYPPLAFTLLRIDIRGGAVVLAASKEPRISAGQVVY